MPTHPKYKPTFNETDNQVSLQSVAVVENGTLTVVENTTDYTIRLQGQNFTLVGSSGDDRFIFDNVEPNVTIKYNVGSGGNDFIAGANETVKLQFVTADGKPVAYLIKFDGNTVLTVGQNTITFNGHFDIENRIVNGGVGFVIGTFKGTLDGDGHKITLNHTASTADCALFDTLQDATIKNLHVDGTIETSGEHAAGFTIKTTGTTTITDCRSSVEINGIATKYAYYGGFVRIVDSGTLNVTNCIFNGKFSSTNPSQVIYTSMVQSNGGTLNLNNCLVAPQALIDNPYSWSSTFYVRNGVAGNGGDNNYYTSKNFFV